MYQLTQSLQLLRDETLCPSLNSGYATVQSASTTTPLFRTSGARRRSAQCWRLIYANDSHHAEYSVVYLSRCVHESLTTG